MISFAQRVATTVAAAIIASAAAGVADAQQYNWKFYTALGTSDKGTQLHRAFVKDVEQASGGRLKITLYTAGELPYKATDVLRAISTRQVDMGHIAVGFMAGDLPQLNVFSVPFSCTSVDAFYDAAMPAIATTFNKEISSKFKVDPLIHWTMPPQQLWLNKPVTKFDDLRNLKVRAWNREQVETMTYLGGSGVSISPAEVITALQRGVVDGAFTAAISAVAWNIFDVIKHGYLINFTLSHEIVVVNDEALKELPEDLQKLLLDKSKEWLGRYRAGVAEADEQALSILKQKGMELREASPGDVARLKELTTPIGEKWAEKYGETARTLLAAVRTACP